MVHSSKCLILLRGHYHHCTVQVAMQAHVHISKCALNLKFPFSLSTCTLFSQSSLLNVVYLPDFHFTGYVSTNKAEGPFCTTIECSSFASCALMPPLIHQQCWSNEGWYVKPQLWRLPDSTHNNVKWLIKALCVTIFCCKLERLMSCNSAACLFQCVIVIGDTYTHTYCALVHIIQYSHRHWSKLQYCTESWRLIFLYIPHHLQ